MYTHHCSSSVRSASLTKVYRGPAILSRDNAYWQHRIDCPITEHPVLWYIKTIIIFFLNHHFICVFVKTLWNYSMSDEFDTIKIMFVTNDSIIKYTIICLNVP